MSLSRRLGQIAGILQFVAWLSARHGDVTYGKGSIQTSAASFRKGVNSPDLQDWSAVRTRAHTIDRLQGTLKKLFENVEVPQHNTVGLFVARKNRPAAR